MHRDHQMKEVDQRMSSVCIPTNWLIVREDYLVPYVSVEFDQDIPMFPEINP